MRRNRSVKIVATLGPASSDHDTIRALFEARADVFRLNMSHGGHDEIRAMFDRLWSHHAAVRHDRFHFVDAGNGTDIAVRFQVTNTLHDGSLVHKSNCNFFTAIDGRFTEVRVYMAGENTLDRTD